MWDLGGRQSLRSIWEKYYSDCKAVVFVVDASNVVPWAEAQAVLKDLLMDARLSGVPFLIFASKADVPGSKHVDEMKKFFNLRELGDAVVKRCHFESASFISAQDNNQGVSAGMDWLEKALLASLDY